VPDLTRELQRMAEDAGRQAPPLAAADVIRQGDRRRRRSLRWQSLGGLSVAVIVAAVLLAVTTLLPASHHARPQPSVQLAAWTVVRQADGTVFVTIRELRDPAGLQRKLRADGVPASVTFSGQLPRSCRRYPASTALTNRVVTIRQAARFPIMVRRLPVLVIHPSALPRGAGVAITPNGLRVRIEVAIGLVHASPQCTGS
jgi:alpha-D-ribose 1-methylphosphonate 5-triphosphate synthase subunit PhnH